ncbi:MAG: glycosyltransferase family 1 protein [Candidatus Nealsonbacteria bacterium]|nr:MAG: glycosyltransferase family 1 protein [Candidatus Nealsonbacteria bacterium]
MKICLVSDTLPGYHKTWSGAELLCWRLGEMLEKEEHEVFFITSPFTQKVISGNKRIFQLPTPLDRISRFIPFFPSFSTHFPADVYSIFRAFIILKKIKPDVVHFHTKKFFLPVMVANLILKIPTVFTVLDYFIICPINTLIQPNGQICKEGQGTNCAGCVYQTRYRIKRIFQPTQIKKLFSKLRAKISHHFMRELNKIVTLTETSKKRLAQHKISSERIKVIYYQLINSKINKIKPSFLSSKFSTILFIGSFYPHKGLQVLIQTIPLVASKVPNIKLKVVGTGDEYQKERIKKLVNDLKINKYIDFLGQKNNEEVLQLILSSEVVAVPEQWPSDFGPIILLEAMMLGKPVVASKIGSVPEFIKDSSNGFLVEYNQPEQFAEKLIWLLKNKASAQSMGEKAKGSVQFLFKDNQGKEILKLYNEITSPI